MQRFNKVLLVFPAFTSDTGSSRPSPSLGYLAQALDDSGIEYDVLDMMLGYPFDYLVEKVNDFKPDLIGFTLFTLHHRTVYELIGRLCRAFPDIKIIVGGPHVSIVGEKVLKDCIDISYACVHEGERTLIELANGAELSKINGLIYRNNGEITTNNPREFESNLSQLNFPRLLKFEIEKYANEIAIISSRGCPYRCIFCSVGLTLGKKVRVRPVSDVVDEIEYWYRRGRRIFNFLDDNFTFYTQRVYDICEEIEKREFADVVLRCSNGVRADKLDEALLERMWDAGFRSIGIGVEAGNNKVLKHLRKGETIEQIENAIETACDIGYEVALFFVLGTPGEGIEDVRDSLKLALKYPVFKIDFYNLIPFPGTELYEWVEESNAWTGDKNVLLNSSTKNIRFGGRSFFNTEELSVTERAILNKEIVGTMRKIERNYIKRVLYKKIGILSTPMSYFIVTKFVQKLYFSNNRFRKIAEKVKYSVLTRR